MLHGNSFKLSKLSMEDIYELPEIFKDCINKVEMFQRNPYSQFYILKNLQNSLHFSLGSTSYRQLLEFCKKYKFAVDNYLHDSSVENDAIWLYNH